MQASSVVGRQAVDCLALIHAAALEPAQPHATTLILKAL
jgi:hypothetical protein